jgi:hypothetical protein
VQLGNSFGTERPTAHEISSCRALNRGAASLENACGIANFGSSSDSEQDASNHAARQLQNSCSTVRPVVLFLNFTKATHYAVARFFFFFVVTTDSHLPGYSNTGKGTKGQGNRWCLVPRVLQGPGGGSAVLPARGAPGRPLPRSASSPVESSFSG